MKPNFSCSSSCRLSSANSEGPILYGLLEIGAVPGSSSITNSTSRSGGIPGNSSGKTSGNSQTTGTLWIASSIIIQSRQRVKLNRRSQTWRKDYMAFRNLQRNRAFSTINHSCICCQPIHAQDDINVRIAQNN